MAKSAKRTGTQNRRKPDYNRLNELIRKACGDRTIPQYAKDAGVDHAVIYKTIHGKETGYKPGVSVLQRLGSPEAAPQGGVTTADLMAAAGFTANSLQLMNSAHTISRLAITAGGGLFASGHVVGASAVGIAAALTGIGLALRKTNRPLSSTEQSKADPELDKFTKARERFKNSARGIIYSALSAKGITFQPGNINAIDTLGFRPDDYVTVLEHNEINCWWFKYAGPIHADDAAGIPFDDLISALLQQVVTAQADRHRKISFVVENPRIFNLLQQFKEHNSFRSNLSVILIDTENVTILDEALISTYDENRSDDPLSIL